MQADRVFKLQKRVVRFIKGCSSRVSCREHFREMKILPLKSQYIYSMIMFAVKNIEIFDTNKDFYDINTRQHMNMHMNQVNLARNGKGAHHTIVNIYNRLPKNLKEITNNPNKFRVSMKEFLFSNVFYTLDEFFRK
jgi:hypothetical protein